MDAGWIPEGEEPGVAEHLRALGDYLAAAGVAEDDSFLLRYALTVPGMQRGIVPPILVLEPNRSGFSDRGSAKPPGKSHDCARCLTSLASF